MTTLTEVFHDGGFIVSEANGHRSRDQVTVLSGETLKAGQVVAKVTASGKYVAWDHAQSAEADGTTTPAGILFGAVDASGGDKLGVIIARDAEVNSNEIVWPDAAQASEKAAAIATLRSTNRIIFRS
jgi:hypothetical protein